LPDNQSIGQNLGTAVFRHSENLFCFYKRVCYFYSQETLFACGKSLESLCDVVEKQKGAFYLYALLNPWINVFSKTF